MLVRRKPGISLSQFREAWEKTHFDIVKSVTGDDFPLAHTRHYLTELYQADHENGYDAIGELSFENRDKFEAFMEKISSEEAAKKIADHDDTFLDRAAYRAFIVEESSSTTRDGSYKRF